MTTIHDDPFDTKQVRTEADRERRAAERNMQAQEEARSRLAKQHLEDEKKRLLSQLDGKKRRLEELRREVSEKQREQKASEETSRTEHQAEASHDARETAARERHILETRLARIRSSLAELASAAQQREDKKPDRAELEHLSRNVATAKAALEKATLEHTHLADEVRQLRRLLEQKETLMEKVRHEKDEAAADAARLEKEKETVEMNVEMSQRSERIAHESVAKAARERAELEREQAEVQSKIAELERKEKELAKDKQEHSETARKADTDKMRISALLRELEFRAEQLVREITMLEKNLRDTENKLVRL